MTFVAVAVLFIAACATIGLTRQRASDMKVAAALAVAMVCLQFVLLMKG